MQIRWNTNQIVKVLDYCVVHSSGPIVYLLHYLPVDLEILHVRYP